MKIRVKVLLGEEHSFDISPTDTVLQVKEKVRDRLGIEVDHQTLLLAGKALADENQISSYPGIKDGSKLTLVKKSAPSKNGVQKFKDEMVKVLRNYYTETDALTIANQVTKNLQQKIHHQSFDDLERIATGYAQDQEKIS